MAQPVKIRSVPITQDPSVQGILSDLKSAVENMQSGSAPPLPPTNFSLTPVSGGISVQFTRSNATNFRLYSSETADRSKAQIVDLGSNNQYTDNLGEGGVQRYYWIEAISPTSNQPSQLVGPHTATSLALGTPASVIPPNQPSYGSVFDTTLGRQRPLVYGTDFVPQGKPRSQQ